MIMLVITYNHVFLLLFFFHKNYHRFTLNMCPNTSSTWMVYIQVYAKFLNEWWERNQLNLFFKVWVGQSDQSVDFNLLIHRDHQHSDNDDTHVPINIILIVFKAMMQFLPHLKRYLCPVDECKSIISAVLERWLVNQLLIPILKNCKKSVVSSLPIKFNDSRTESLHL